MRKRVKKKLGLPWINKYNVLFETRRLSRKNRRKDSWYVLSYRFLPIGEKDYRTINEDEVTPDYPFASHWVIGLFCWNHESFSINAFPCSKDGSSPTPSPVRIIELGYVKEHNALETFEDILTDINNDRFWDN